jgi:DNA polymerase III subunit gamma/tau
MLFKGLAEVKEAPRPLAAAEMVLVRIAYAADLPSPEEVVRSLGDVPRPAAAHSDNAALAPQPSTPTPRRGRAGEAVRSARPAPPVLAAAVVPKPSDPVVRSVEAPAAALSPTFAHFDELIAFVGDKRDLQLKTALERDVRLVHFEDGRLEIALEPGAPQTLATELSRRLAALTGRRWMVAVSDAAGQPTVREQIAARHEAFRRGVQADPLVQTVLARFPGAEIVAVRQPERDAAPSAPAGDDEDAAPDLPVDDEASAFGAHRRTEDGENDGL